MTGQPPEDLLALFSVDATGLVRIDGYHRRVNAVMQKFTWATLKRGDGWYFQWAYLDRVEQALYGAGIALASTDGTSSPRQMRNYHAAARRHTEDVVAEIAKARETAGGLGAREAFLEARRAFAEAVARRHPNPGPPEPDPDAEP